jgi:hypothetical protein
MEKFVQLRIGEVRQGGKRNVPHVKPPYRGKPFAGRHEVPKPPLGWRKKLGKSKKVSSEKIFAPQKIASWFCIS